MILVYFAIGFVLAIAYLYWRNAVRKKRLGKCLMEVDNKPFRSAILTVTLLRFLGGIVAIGMIVYFKDKTLIGRIAFLVFFGQMLASEVINLFMMKEKTGIYENGIISNTGIRLYDEIDYFYETSKDKNFIYLISFSPKIFVYKQSRMYIYGEDRMDARKILRKKIEFDPDRKGIRKF